MLEELSPSGPKKARNDKEKERENCRRRDRRTERERERIVGKGEIEGCRRER